MLGRSNVKLKEIYLAAAEDANLYFNVKILALSSVTVLPESSVGTLPARALVEQCAVGYLKTNSPHIHTTSEAAEADEMSITYVWREVRTAGEAAFFEGDSDFLWALHEVGQKFGRCPERGSPGVLAAPAGKVKPKKERLV
jgi:hypothetical protein